MTDNRDVIVTIEVVGDTQKIECELVLWSSDEYLVECRNALPVKTSSVVGGVDVEGREVLLLDRESVLGIEGPREKIRRPKDD